jgi:serine/threonine protein kinase
VLEGDEGVETAVVAAIEAVRQDLPPLLAEIIGRVLLRVGRLPRDAVQGDEVTRVTRKRRQLHLPAWLPPSQIIGGFYIVRPIGNGAGGSVFVARRAEERHEENAETFALKIPAYTGAAAHTLSEDEFMQLFREEAGALLTLPHHPNIAGFVTFDAGARPKPILVMELVNGPTLERLVDRRELSMPLVLDVLSGMAAGLVTMHQSGLAHLDVKPGNVILRGPARHTTALRVPKEDRRIPVLVDFGLAGRKVRPGCGSPYYGAPEVWDLAAFSTPPAPSSTDVYAFSCLAFELLTGAPLFAAESLPAVVSAHLSHDGIPSGLAWLRDHKTYGPLGELLSQGLRRDPGQRISMFQLRDALTYMGTQSLRKARWPLRP